MISSVSLRAFGERMQVRMIAGHEGRSLSDRCTCSYSKSMEITILHGRSNYNSNYHLTSFFLLRESYLHYDDVLSLKPVRTKSLPLSQITTLS